MDLNTVWFLLIVILLCGYAILDGFDLGVGILHLLARNENERRININAIGPVWDGNEVWLLTGGGALFAAFPIVYATVFSGFYLAFILLLFALIFRAVSLEFRGKVDSLKWKKFWDWSFSLGSILPALLFGIAFGNILRGIPIDQNMNFTGSFFDLLNPYSLLIGVVSLVMFSMHGAVYMTTRTERSQRVRYVSWATWSWVILVVLYIFATYISMKVSPFLFEDIVRNPLYWILLFLLIFNFTYTIIAVNSYRYFKAMITSSLLIIAIIGYCALSLYPRLVPSSIDLYYSLTIYNSCSTPRTLSTMLIITLIGMPIVIIYTIYIYRVFKGKVNLTKDSY
jgi:cytochrome d ubiquinol oxidase subunit II